MTRAIPRDTRHALLAVLALTLAAGLWGCAHGRGAAPAPPADGLWRTFEQRRADADDAAGILATASLHYADAGKSHRLTLKLWGAPALPLRMDLAAGVGTTVAMLLEESTGWTGYFPSEEAAYAGPDALFGQQALGMDLPFTLRELAGMVTGTYAGFAPISYETGEPAPDESARYVFAPVGPVTRMTLDAQGRPVVFAGRLHGRKWTMTLSRHRETPSAPPGRIDISMEPDTRATLRIKRLERRTTPWPGTALKLPLPPGTAITPLAAPIDRKRG